MNSKRYKYASVLIFTVSLINIGCDELTGGIGPESSCTPPKGKVCCQSNNPYGGIGLTHEWASEIDCKTILYGEAPCVRCLK